MVRYCLTLDLIDDAALIAEYEEHHRQLWPAVLESIKDSGIVHMEIFRWGNRLCMIINAKDDFSFDAKSAADESNTIVQQWEQLMWKYQQPLPGTAPGEKWVLMERIFSI